METERITSPIEKTIQEKYLESLLPKERKAYEIAKDHLGMSFQLEKSIGFISFKKEEEKK